MTSHYAVARVLLLFETEIARTMLNQLVELLECSFIEQKIDSLARRQFSRRVLLLYAGLATALFSLLRALAELIKLGKFRWLLFLGTHCQ